MMLSMRLMDLSTFIFNLKHGPVSQTPSPPPENTTIGIDSDLKKTNEDILAFQKIKKIVEVFICLHIRQANKMLFVAAQDSDLFK